MKKIASLFWSMEIGVSGGAGKIHASAGKILANSGYDVTYLQMEDGKPRYDHIGKVYSFNKKFHRGFGIKKIIGWVVLSYKVAKYCNKNNIEMVLGHGDYFFMVVGLSKLFGNKSICVGYLHTTISVRNKFIVWILQRTLKRCDYLIFTSLEEKIRFENTYKFPSKKHSLLYNPIAIKTVIEQGKAELEKKYAELFSNGLFTFISVARYSYQKNIPLLVASFNEFWNSNKKSQLLIIGDGEEWDRVTNLIEGLPSKKAIHMLGNHNNPHKFLSRADCFLLTSRFEGFPMVLIEALVHGLPIVSLDCPTGPAEILDILEKKDFTKNGIQITHGGVCCDFVDGDECLQKGNIIEGMKYIMNSEKYILEKMSKINKEKAYTYSENEYSKKRKKIVKDIL